MGLRNSFASLFTDAEKVLMAVDANAEQLPGVDQAKAGLVQAVAELRDLSTRRDTLKAEKQALSQRLKEASGRTQEKLSELRSLLKFMLGMRNEKLVEFNVPPRRLGVRRTTATTPVVTAAPATALPATPVVTGDGPSNS